MLLFIILMFSLDTLQIWFYDSTLLYKFVTLLFKLVFLFVKQTIITFNLLVQRSNLFFEPWKHLQCHFFRIIKLCPAVIYLLFWIQKLSISFYYRIGLSSDRNNTILILLYPKHHIGIFLFKRFNLTAIISQINNKLIIIHWLYDGIFYKIRIKFWI